MENNKIGTCNKTCKTCEFCFYDNNKEYYICTSGDTELGAGGNRIYDFKKIRSCWYIGYEEYIIQKRIKKIYRKIANSNN